MNSPCSINLLMSEFVLTMRRNMANLNEFTVEKAG